MSFGRLSDRQPIKKKSANESRAWILKTNPKIFYVRRVLGVSYLLHICFLY